MARSKKTRDDFELLKEAVKRYAETSIAPADNKECVYAERERQNRFREYNSFAKDFKYGCQISIHNKILSKLHEYSKQHWYLAKYGLSPKQRIQWERNIWNYIRREYKAVYKKNLPLLPEHGKGVFVVDRLSDFEIEKVNDLVSRFNIDDAIREVCKEK